MQLLCQVLLHRFGQYVHLDDQSKEKNCRQREAEGLGNRVVNITLEGRSNGGEQHAQEGEDKSDQKLQDAARQDEGAEAHEEEPAEPEGCKMS